MKKAIIIPLIILLFGCNEQGPPGPEGPRGPQGPVGESGESGYVFEYENVSFTAPDYSVLLLYPDDFEGLASDVALVYFLWDVQDDNGTPVEVWRPLPQDVFLDYGSFIGNLVYNYDHTLNDVRLFLNADFSLDLLEPIDTDNWVVRVVVVPGEFWGGRLDEYPSYEEVEEVFGLPEFPVKTNVKARRTK